MAGENLLGLELIFNSVKTRFAAEATDVQVVFGWKRPGQQLLQSGVRRANRIAFVPGIDFKGAGDYASARAPGRNPRPLRTMLEACTVYCWAFDGATEEIANSELAQWRAARFLHDATVRAIELSMRSESEANLTAKPYSKPEWVLPDRERMFGAELKFILTLESPIFDTVHDLGGTDPAIVGTPTPETTQPLQPAISVELTDDLSVAGEVDPPPLTP